MQTAASVLLHPYDAFPEACRLAHDGRFGCRKLTSDFPHRTQQHPALNAGGANGPYNVLLSSWLRPYALM